MERRLFLGLPLVFSGLAKAEEKPWVARVLKGGFDGTHWWMGFGVALQPKWKTYWRVPGDGGIAPDLKLAGMNLKSFNVLHPLPKRFEDASGTTIGYKENVVFPIRIEPKNPTERIQLQFNSFIGVCDVVCIPAQSALEFAYDPEKPDMRDQAEISQWQAKVPVVSPNAVGEASIVTKGDNMVLRLELNTAVDDIFVESRPAHYFGKPKIENGLAELVVRGAKSIEELRLFPTRVTLDAGGQGLEQIVRVI